MENKNAVLQEEQTACIQAAIENIISTRHQLFHFAPTENNLVMTFTLPDGNQVQVPIQDPYKVRMLIGEVRNYLGERQLLKERELNSFKVNTAEK
jgi:hypothetical protein